MNCKRCGNSRGLRPFKNNYYCKKCYKQKKQNNNLNPLENIFKEIGEMLKK